VNVALGPSLECRSLDFAGNVFLATEMFVVLGKRRSQLRLYT